ncbi:MAG: NosD domain-containing protein, partial [Isosphaeraceae bacterium]
MGLLKRRRRSRAVFAGASCIVEALESRSLLSVFMVTNTGDNGGVDPAPGAGTGTLRQAIIDSDSSNPTGTNTIDFDIPGSGVQTIEPLTPLPTIIEPTAINGYSQPGASPNTLTVGDNAVILIALDGNGQSTSIGLYLDASNSSVSGLSIGGFAHYGIDVQPAASNANITGNFIGLDPSGNDLGNGLYGIAALGANTTIGGPAPAARNVIAANSTTGIDLGANATANIYAVNTGLIVQGNYIGTDPSGNFTRGYADPIDGIDLAGNGTTTAQGAQIGGSSAGEGNVINTYGGSADPISISGGAGNEIIQGNSIGVNPAETAGVSGGGYGIWINSSSNNTIGGPSAGDGNVIGGAGVGIVIANVSNGILGAAASGNVVQGNWIGINPAGTVQFSNQQGIEIHGASSNLIGGTLPGEGNTIEYNLGDAVNIFDGYDFSNNLLATANQDQVVGNSIYANGGLGIDLDQGITIPFGGIHTSGSNNLQNQPTIAAANIAAGQLQISGNFLSDTASGSKLKLDVYVSDSSSSSIYAQGQTFVGETTLTSGTGTVNFGPLNFNGGSLFQYVTATLTDASGNTSEFSTPILIGNPFLVTNTNDSGAGSLRQAIIEADSVSSSQPNVIQFNIPGNGVQTIAPLTPLPSILQPTIIDGYSQPGSSPNTSTTSDNANLQINLSGANLTTGGYGLYITGSAASGSAINGLAINGFADGVVVDKGAAGNTIAGDFIGTDRTGMTGVANTTYGVEIETANNIIGGTTPAAANLISANGDDGLLIDGTSATGNTVQGNYIGVNAASTAALANSGSGVAILDGASHNLIGGTSSGNANIIDDNTKGGVYAASNNGHGSLYNTIVANSIYQNDLTNFGYRGIELLGSPPASIPGNYGITTPVLASAVYQSNILTLTGHFPGTGSGTLSLDVYSNNSLDQNSTGEGQTYVGRYSVNNGSGTVSLGSIHIPGTFALGAFITATFTDSSGNTSEFSNPVPVLSTSGQTTFVVTNTNDSGPGSLRDAILEADFNTVTASTITFDIPGNGVQTIEPLTPLPIITEPTTIDGYSQPGASPNTLAVGDNAVILIDLNGSQVAAGNDGLDIDASNSVVRGLAIGGFQGIPDPTNPDPANDAGGNGISTYGGISNITIAGNFIGTDASGNTAVANILGVNDNASGDTIGGLAPADRNIISGNASAGIGAGTNAVIEGNYIGTDTSGLTALTGDVDSGVGISQNGVTGAISRSVQLGGNTPAARNVIVSTGFCVEIILGAFDNIVEGNYIGINATATATFPNQGGIWINSASNNTIGGAGAGQGNVIGGAVGTNSAIQVLRAFNNTIEPDSTGNVIQGNWIGISPTGAPLSNGTGITFGGTSNNTVGGTTAGAGNIIADNVGDGVDIGAVNTSDGNNLTPASGDTIVGNSIYDNALGLGIDLLAGPDEDQGGITPQTPGIHDSGSNNLQNLPNITAANIVNGQLQISGNFLSDTPAGSSLTLDVYVSNTFGYSGYGPGQTYVGETTLTSGSGTVNFGPLSFSGGALGQFVTATLTDSSGNTSEFSNALYIGDPFVVTNTNDSGFGSLRQAIINADTFPDNPDTDLIHFDIPGSGVQKITLESPLPEITNAVTIDGYTQPGSSPNTLTTGDNAVIKVEINGASAGTAYGLFISGSRASGSTIEGLAINQFEAAGITTVQAATGITIAGNFIGTDPTGTTSLGNDLDGIFIETANNTIGGPSPAAANLISGNTDSGVKIYQTAATGNIIQGNYIGSNAAATAALGNGGDGVTISDGASSNTVGGTAAGDGNVITGNGGDGVYMYWDTGAPYPVDNTIVGNSMYLNTGLGIQLSGYIVGGYNPYLQNIPFLTDAVYQNGTLTINGEFPGSGSGTLLLDLYVSNAADPSGFVEGKTYLGQVTINNGTGFVSLGSIDVTGPFTVGQLITATLTNPAGETSEFSNPAEVSAFDTNPLVVTNTNDSGNGSLRAAILYANANPIAGGAPNVISFDIPGSGVQTITPLTPLPDLTEPVTIDGYTQPGASQNTLTTGDNANILIQISDVDLPDSTSTDVLAMNTSDSLIRGLMIDVPTGLGNAIHILPNNTNDVIAGNFIYGMEAAGHIYFEQQYGVFIDSAPGNIVGGTTPADRNVISENSTGVDISGTGATGNLIEGNYLGPSAAATATNIQGYGVDIEGSGGNTIGGTSTGAQNLISGNDTDINLNPTGPTGDVVEGNYIGINAAGTAPLGSAWGIFLYGPDNTIGGTASGAGNLIGDGVGIFGASSGLGDSSGNTIQGNTILNISGNPIKIDQGISIEGSPNNLIGGTTAAARNVTVGISIFGAGADNNTIQGNYIGINAAGTTALTAGFGLGVLEAGPTLIGGTTPGAGNVISGNASGPGIAILLSDGDGADTIQGNIIGLDPTGTFAIGNTSGIEVYGVPDNLIGGSVPGAGNLISGNTGYGIAIGDASGTIIQGNKIGTDISGKVAIGNTGDGIYLASASGITVGGTSAGDGNLIENNTGDGVYVDDASSDNAIEGNSIFANGNLGIELEGYNPSSTPVAGNATNIPVIVSAVASASTTNVEVNLDDAANQTYRVEFFSNPAVDHSGFGEGQVYLGYANILTDGSGNADTTITLPVSVSAGLFITATVTSAAGTSEFSAATEVVAATAAPVVTTNPLSQTLTVGQDASFSAAATGSPPPTVQWMVEVTGGTFSPISGATSDTLNLGAATLAESGNQYEAVFSNGGGSPVTTTAATLTVNLAPVVTANPLSQTLTVGQDASFTAAASGNPTPTVQWMVELAGGTTFSPISGATSDTLNLGAAARAESGNEYEAVFSNGVGSPATTTAATLTVNLVPAAPVVTTNPLSQTLTVGQDASFTAEASGYPTPTVQWMVEVSGGSTFTTISGATSDTLDLGAATLAESGNQYEAVFSNGVGSPATTTAATLTVNPAPAAPVVTTNPLSQTLTVGQVASFTAAASGNPPPTVQWMVEVSGGSTFSPISGATSDTLNLGTVTLAESGNQYEAVFSNGVGSPATTTAATLTVNPAPAAPVVTTNPLSQTLTVGQ